MRLSHGFVRGETLSCIYHGWRFGTDGACRKIPAHPAVEPPKTINCGPLPVAETNGVVWGAVNRPAEDPVTIEGYEALRSLVIAAPVDAISGSDAGEIQLGGYSARLLLNPFGPDEVFVIVLVETGLSIADRLAVSTAAEALRRSAEAKEAAA